MALEFQVGVRFYGLVHEVCKAIGGSMAYTLCYLWAFFLQ